MAKILTVEIKSTMKKGKSITHTHWKVNKKIMPEDMLISIITLEDIIKNIKENFEIGQKVKVE